MIARATSSEIQPLVDADSFPLLDRQLHAAVSTALATSKYIPLRQLGCRVADGVVEISGTVSSFYLKQLAQAAVLQLHGDRPVRNLVEVTGETAGLIPVTRP